MRKINVLSFLSLDGVVQAPGGPEEDNSGGFKYGGWTVPYFDESLGKIMGEQMKQPFHLLLGKKTFDIFASYWPEHSNDWEGVNEANKYVASHTSFEPTWENTTVLSGDIVNQIRQLKSEEGPDIQVHGSANLIQTLLQNDLVDELWLKIFPITLGKGKRLFEGGTIPVAFTLMESLVLPTGVIIANYKRVGEVKTGSFE